MRIVDGDTVFTEDDIDYLKEYSECLIYPPKPITDWYSLLHKCQGSLTKTFELGHIYTQNTGSRKRV